MVQSLAWECPSPPTNPGMSAETVILWKLDVVFPLLVKWSVSWKELLPWALGTKEFLRRASPQDTWEEEDVGLEAVGLLHRYIKWAAERRLMDLKYLQCQSRSGTRTASCFHIVSWRKPQPAELCHGIILALRILSIQKARGFVYISFPRGLSPLGWLNLHHISDTDSFNLACWVGASCGLSQK